MSAERSTPRHPMTLDFTGKVALVTGASRGIGHRIAADLAAAGATLITTSTRAGDGDRLRSAFGVELEHIAADFGDAASLAACVQRVRALPALDVCVNNAGIARHGPFASISDADWTATHDVNLRAPFRIAQAAAAVMCARGSGRIVNVGSVWSHRTMGERAAYTAAKFGLRGLTMTMAVELAPAGVLVNMVAPGFTLTDMVAENYSEERRAAIAATIPVGRLGEVAEVAAAVLFLASELNTYITGQSLVVDGGYCAR